MIGILESTKESTTRIVAKALRDGIPVHFYGPGCGKSTLSSKLREMGIVNISEAGEVCDLEETMGYGCMSVPENFSGLLIYFSEDPVGKNLPGLINAIYCGGDRHNLQLM